MPIILAALIVWGSGQSGPRATALLLVPLVLLTIYQWWRQSSSVSIKNLGMIGTAAAMAAVTVAACIAQIPQMLWIVPAMAAGYGCAGKSDSERNGQIWIWGIAVGAAALCATSLWFPRFLYDKEFLIDSQGLISIAATVSTWVYTRGMELLILVAALEGFRLLYSTSNRRSLAGLILVLVWICAGTLIGSVPVLSIGVAACIIGIISGWNRALRDSGGNHKVRSIAAYCLSLAAILFAAVTKFSQSGNLINWFDWLYVLQIKIAALTPGISPDKGASLGLSGFAWKMLVAACLWNVAINLFRAFQRDSLLHEQRAVYLSRLAGFAIWSFVSGAGILDPLLWWALNSLPQDQKSREEADGLSTEFYGADTSLTTSFAAGRSYSSNIGSMAAKALWGTGAIIYLIAAVLSGGEISTSLRVAGLLPGPLTDEAVVAHLQQTLPNHPIVKYLNLRNRSTSGEHGGEKIDITELELLAKQAAQWPPLAPWGYMLLSDAAWDLMLLSDISDMSRNRDLCVNSAMRVLNDDENSSAELLVRCSERLRYLEREDDSLIALEKAVKMNPYDPGLRRKLAIRYHQARLEDNAFRQIRAALELDPTGNM